MAVAAALTAVSSLVGGIAQKQASDYQAAVARRNAEIARNNANMAVEAGQIEAQRRDLEVADMLGTQQARFGASGLSGRTQELVRSSTRRIGRQGSKDIIDSSTQEGRNFLQQEADFKGQAAMAKREGQFALLSGALGAAGSFAGDAFPTKSSTGNWFTKAKINSIKAVRRI